MNNSSSIGGQDVLDKILVDIELYDWHVVVFLKENPLPAYGYTIGLTKNFHHPEIVLFGMQPDGIFQVLNHIGSLVKEGRRLVPNVEYFNEFLVNYAVDFLEVDPEYHSKYLQYCEWYYQGAEYSALQMVWPDAEGRFPWAQDFDVNFKFDQPLLDRNTDFLFYEERNLGVYTTRQVLEEQFPILAVYHEDDGDWQFLCDTTTDVADLRIIALEQVVGRDCSLNELFDLPSGWKATRANAESEWIKVQDTDP